MGLSVGLASQSKGALGEFLPKGFRLLALFKATRRLPVVTRPYLQTSSRCSGNRGCLFHVPILLPFILKKKVNSAHPFSNGAKGLATFLLKPTSASNDERFLSKNLVPVRRRNVQWSVRAFAILLVVTDQSPHFSLNVIRQLQGNQMLSNCMRSPFSLVRTISCRLGSKTSNPAQ